MNRQTTLAKNHDVARTWVHIDATDKVLGRLAAEIAMILSGKAKASYTPHHDVGDFVVVTNAHKVRVTGKKLDQNFQEHFTGYTSGRKTQSWRQVKDGRFPERLLIEAVKGMLPKTKLGRAQLSKLKAYAGAEHPHQAQNPATISVDA